MRPISSLRLPVDALRPRGTLCARLQACHAALQICTYPNQRNLFIVITLQLRARIRPTRRYRIDNPLIQSS
jgi:hypothetical protein